MATLNRFEDIKAWQVARKLAKKIFILTRNDWFAKDFSLKDQVKRASGSVMDNIAEGFDRGGNKEFIHFLYIAKASNAEVRSQLYRALDLEYISQNEFKEAYELSIEASKVISGFIKYLKTSELKGSKYSSPM